MGKKPEPQASDVSTKKVIESKTPAVAVPQAQPGKPLSEEAVRVGAYLRWDAAGRPGGDGVSFWLEAEQELRAGSAAPAAKALPAR
jgi:hypothetical protein